jgi:hypothetical protein
MNYEQTNRYEKYSQCLQVALVRDDRRKEGKFGGDSRAILGGVNVMLLHYTNHLRPAGVGNGM